MHEGKNLIPLSTTAVRGSRQCEISCYVKFKMSGGNRIETE